MEIYFCHGCGVGRGGLINTVDCENVWKGEWVSDEDYEADSVNASLPNGTDNCRAMLTFFPEYYIPDDYVYNGYPFEGYEIYVYEEEKDDDGNVYNNVEALASIISKTDESRRSFSSKHVITTRTIKILIKPSVEKPGRNEGSLWLSPVSPSVRDALIDEYLFEERERHDCSVDAEVSVSGKWDINTFLSQISKKKRAEVNKGFRTTALVEKSYYGDLIKECRERGFYH